MDKIVFAFVSTGLDIETQIHVASIRQFAGPLSESPIWMFTPKSEKKIPKNLKERFLSLDVQIIPFSMDPKHRNFPFATYVFATATAESFAKRKTDILAWLLPDTLIMNTPTHFLLPKGKSLGFRPVHHTLIGSIYNEPIDPFWDLIYRKCDVPVDKIFPLKTHVDHNILRPYFNAGFLVVRPERGLLQSWWNFFQESYNDPDFDRFYQKDERYTIFMHQAILAGVILSTLEKAELQELPFSYNYPLHLYHESPKEYRPQNLDNLITARYEEVGWLNKVPLHEPLKSWLTNQLKSV
ncbi:MAG: hypothetical protein JSW11_16915 [Candidatus Heimdallarchaeota archaeon]|nr:MAG: hypothetical protein JSW11_16915 [Candidatus Heimdallarchaeota archaeon]